MFADFVGHTCSGIEYKGTEKLDKLPEDVKKTVMEYIETSALAADHDCLYLYVQGAKDCMSY